MLLSDIGEHQRTTPFDNADAKPEDQKNTR